jgi:glycosyltransferase involved in cell wall biosynthesis
VGDARRIAFVITELEVGGAERCLVNLATRLDRARFEPLVVSLAPRPAAGRDGLVNELEQAQVPVRFLELKSTWQYNSGVARLARALVDYRPEIVQTFLFHANVLGAAAARRVGIPHALAGIRVADPRRWRAWVERFACRHVERFVCVSEGVAQHCGELGYPSGKLTVVPNGVAYSRFAGANPMDLARLGLPAGRRAILFVGRLDRQKGLDDLLAIGPQVLAALPLHDLILVGDGPERGAMEKLASSLGIAPRVHVAGWRADVPAIMAAAEMLVLPSRWEGMPNVVLEAMAAGKPVVATRTPGAEEALGELAAEQCVELGSREELAQRIIQFAQNPQLGLEVGRRNQRRAAEVFSIEAMVARYERLYDSILS